MGQQGPPETEMSETPVESAGSGEDEHQHTCTVNVSDRSAKLQAGGTSQLGCKECRICLSCDSQDDIVAPCTCTGSVKYAHLSCLRKWCMENMSLRCEICGNIYKDEVVNALMSTLVEAQERQAATPAPSHAPPSASRREATPGPAAMPWPAAEPGRPMQPPSSAAVRIDLNRPRMGDRAGLEGAMRIVRLQQQNGETLPPLDPEAERRAQERMQAFLEELLHVYTMRSEAILRRHNRDGFQREEELRARRRAIGIYACAVALLIFWIALFFSLSSMLTSNRFLGASLVLVAIMLAVAVAGVIRVRVLMRARADQGRREEVSRREARDAARARLRERADMYMLRPATVRIIR